MLDVTLAGKEKLYINGNLQLTEESTPLLAELKYLHVNGEVHLLPEQKEEFLGLQPECIAYYSRWAAGRRGV